MALLAVPHRFPHDLRHDAHSRHSRNAPSHLHLRSRTRLGNLESDLHDRRCVPVTRDAHLRAEYSSVPAQRTTRRKRSLGCLDSRVVHEFTAAGIQLHRGPDCQEPPSALGHQAPQRPRLEIRMNTIATIPLDEPKTAVSSAESSTDWAPSKGVVGMTCLIIAESAI